MGERGLRLTLRPLSARIALTLCGLGAALHLYTALFSADDTASDGGLPLFLIGLVLWSCLPYALCAAAALRCAAPMAGAGGMRRVLLPDGRRVHAVQRLRRPQGLDSCTGPAVHAAVERRADRSVRCGALRVGRLAADAQPVGWGELANPNLPSYAKFLCGLAAKEDSIPRWQPI